MQIIMQKKSLSSHILKIDKSILIGMVGIVFSCFSSIMLIVLMMVGVLIVLLKQKKEIMIKYLLFLQIRSLLNPGIAVPFSAMAQIIKWASIFIVSILVFLTNKQIDNKTYRLHLLFLIFGLYMALSSLFMSSYPTISVFKVISYIVPFLAIIDGLYYSRNTNWIHIINICFGLVSIGSVVLVFHPYGYMRNGHAFQGFLNHPNVYGVILALFLAAYLFEHSYKNLNIKNILIICICFVLIILSESRTGFLSAVIALLINITYSRKKDRKALFLLAIYIGVLLIFATTTIWDKLLRFLYKGGNAVGDIGNTRLPSIVANLNRFLNSPLFGTGFNVPYIAGVRDYSFALNVAVENGNLLTAILGDLGFIGFCLFCICYAYIFIIGKCPNGYSLFFIPFIVSLGEMAFFSTNNYGLLLYMIFGVYISNTNNTD